MTRKYRIVDDGEGMGGFLDPPGHPNHTMYAATTKDTALSLSHVPDPDCDASPEFKAHVGKILADAELKASELWIRYVYGYFKTMYVPESGSRRGSDLLGLRDYGTTPPPPERHAAVACIREHFPNHEPRLDLIENPGRGYGSYPCDKCGQRVQYEARHDALVRIEHWPSGPQKSVSAECPGGGAHEVA